jgi:hypothetical protein
MGNILLSFNVTLIRSDILRELGLFCQWIDRWVAGKSFLQIPMPFSYKTSRETMEAPGLGVPFSSR